MLAVAFLVMSVAADTALVASAAADTASIEQSFAADPEAQAIALDLFATTGDVASVGADEQLEGGFRGTLHLVPELPIGPYRKHLTWVAHTAKALDDFAARQFGDVKPNYHWHDIMFRFVRSVDRTTPSAYALIENTGVWTIHYNVAGSLMTSEASVREVITHELFHLNDEAHGNWARKTLDADFKAIVKKCGTNNACLAPYAPAHTKVRGSGSYYAFQRNNGSTVGEYAAELAVRYVGEQNEMLTRGRLSARAFKCGPPENARAWTAMVTEFFGGVDRVPACR